MSQNGFVNGQYDFIKNMERLYDRLQDEISRKIFWARLQYEVSPNMDQYVQLSEITGNYKIAWREPFETAAAEGKKVVLYGAGGTGTELAQYLICSHIDFHAFCDRGKAGKMVCGKPVLAPQEIIDEPGKYIVIITTVEYHNEVCQFLQENGFPTTAVVNWFGGWAPHVDQYREFPELFKRGTAIVDAGCYDGEDSIRFSQWCEGRYSKIYAFEPDPANYSRCKANIEAAKLPNVTLLQAGLSNFTGESAFIGTSDTGSHLADRTEIKYNVIHSELDPTVVRVYALDDLVDTEIGLIKMDIEGAELDALHGAKRVIQKDKPQLAICVYHRQGDMLAIMDYLHNLVPEYRFWLRHYGPTVYDTVLFAAI